MLTLPKPKIAPRNDDASVASWQANVYDFQSATYDLSVDLAEGVNVLKATAVAGNRVVEDTDSILLIDTRSASSALTLGNDGFTTGHVLVIKDAFGTANVNNIVVTGTIDGALSSTLSSAYQVLRLVFNGTNWSVI